MGNALGLARMGSMGRAWRGRNFLQSLLTTSVPAGGKKKQNKTRKQPEPHSLREKQDTSMKPVCVPMVISKLTPEVLIESCLILYSVLKPGPTIIKTPFFLISKNLTC